jgi:hypothetical protein
MVILLAAVPALCRARATAGARGTLFQIKEAHQEIEWVILGRQIAGSMHVRILSRRYS